METTRFVVTLAMLFLIKADTEKDERLKIMWMIGATTLIVLVIISSFSLI